MNSKARISIILLILLVIVTVVYLYPTWGFDVKKLRLPDVVSSPESNAKVAIGKHLEIVLRDDKIQKADSVILSLNEKRISNLQGNLTTKIETKGLPLGNHNVQITIFHNGKSKTIGIPFVVVSDVTPAPMSYTKLAAIPHDNKSYTQGLELVDNMLYESGGQYKESLIRIVQPKTGKVIKNISLPAEVFAEGLTVLQDKVYQITWKEGICYIYDKDLNLLKKTSFRSTNGEGWGLANNGKSLLVSDGTHRITYLNPETMAMEKTLAVYGGNNEAAYLNELEYVDGFIYANIYTTDQIAKIEESTGKIVAVADLSSLKNENQDGEVLNGIAYLPSSKTFLITGKYWKSMYEIKFY